ncbi:MAG: 16S rRNA (uracil(1498)-N(3))-methyltransferase [Bdellovibrionales bacterium]|nr:16S rRNA (uracil(1498)-N(3))-methyltransferase [Bdellovibrionales bacterium]
MRRALCEDLSPHRSSLIEIPEGEVKHLTSVLRLGPGDLVELMDGTGKCAPARLVFRDKKVFGELTASPTTNPKLLSLPIHLKMSILKGEAMEWVVEKAVELGVRSLTPVESEFTVVKIHKKGAETFIDRWQKIADQSLKQCGRLDRMEILPPRALESLSLSSGPLYWLDEALAITAEPHSHLSAHLRADQSPRLAGVSLLIGPEGGFSASERSRLLQLTVPGNKGINRVHLGPLILRAETAALLGISILVGEHYGKWENQIQTSS